MGRTCLTVGLLLSAVVLASCGGGGGSSPTDPPPPPLSSLAGTWRGEISGTGGGAAFTCPLVLELEEDEEDEGFYFGSWDADCPGNGAVGVATIIDVAGLRMLSAFSLLPGPQPHPLAVCGWSVQLALRGDELSGNWSPPQNCEDQSITGGPVRVRLAG
jgi:hypothetical protein